MSISPSIKTSRTILRKRNIAIFFFAIGSLATALFFLYFQNGAVASNGVPSNFSLPYHIKRLGGYKNVRPLVSVEPDAESETLNDSKIEITRIIDSLKQAGAVEDVSVYFRKTNTDEWTSINDKTRYHPASLMKVPLMLAWLKMAEADPSILKQQLNYKIDDSKLPKSQNFKGPSIEDGKKYTIHDLIFYMMAYSDNRATYALQQFADAKLATQLFKDLGLPFPRPDDPNYLLSASEYSMFIKLIFNSTYNSPEFSEYGSEMMSNSSYKEGFEKGFPAGTKMWHKFGEWSNNGMPEELHQSGVIFIGNEPYILTIMTRGKGMDNLAKIVELVCRKVYSSTMKFS